LHELLGNRLSIAAPVREQHGKDASYHPCVLDYGKSIPYTSDPFPAIGLLQKSTVVFAINTAAFYAFYVDLLTRRVPVKFAHEPPHHDFDDD
jgi:hypothetical protein